MVNWGIAVRGICENNGKILLMKVRSKSVHDACKWELPGGKVKRNEFFDESLIREFKEETDLDVEVIDFIKVVENDYVACKTKEKVKSLQIIMEVKAEMEKIRISNEHDQYDWFTIEEIKDMALNNQLSKAATDVFLE